MVVATCDGRSDNVLVPAHILAAEIEFFIGNLLGPNPLNHQNDFSRPALRHGNLISLLQVALYLRSYWR